MANKPVNSPNAPAAIGPYSHSVLANGNMQFISGQLGIDPTTGKMADTVEEQAVQAFANLGAILKETDMDYSNIVKTLVFLTDMSDFAEVNKIYATYFPENPPARSAVAVAALPMGAKFEIEAVAVK